ncbi:hypothetical protein JCM24511_03670 [Saitozyma sp. JCM 24511]|nr:hypothetical protein JCM24511_03670 [Saitozyma sp. JCM 24511]
MSPPPDPPTIPIPIPPPPSAPFGVTGPPPVPPTTPRHTRRTKSGPGTPAPRAFKARRRKERGDTATRLQTEGSRSGSGSGTGVEYPTEETDLAERQAGSSTMRGLHGNTEEIGQVGRGGEALLGSHSEGVPAPPRPGSTAIVISKGKPPQPPRR